MSISAHTVQGSQGEAKDGLEIGLSIEDKWVEVASKFSEKFTEGELQWSELTDDDFVYDVRQKAVDSRIAVDIASLSLKQQVDRIVLIAGDADFVPASKLARREGIDFVLDPLHNHIDESLHEHIDGCHSKGLRPKKRKLE